MPRDANPKICFTDEQLRRLGARAEREGKTLAQVVRDAVEAYVAEAPPDLEAVLRESFASMPDLDAPCRDEWDRGYG